MPLTRIDRVLSAMTNLRPANVVRSHELKEAEDERGKRSPYVGEGDRFGAS